MPCIFFSKIACYPVARCMVRYVFQSCLSILKHVKSKRDGGKLADHSIIRSIVVIGRLFLHGWNA